MLIVDFTHEHLANVRGGFTDAVNHANQIVRD
ncbi:Unannotated [Lentimonas sp. CC19]|nr:Unannotated [Lentimonas sp. CC4]CAA6687295.1 Unannotated [Lentimonas sp. CC6]CAA6696798.1 Unannotated [Lentimonas sp. CC19]CAA6697407.1 Unannotated [Lentimonas sp. CC10]CAA7171791.1 Unannotated [Lentimonas sp. CC21]CAA7183436.1 Unannotated [Lentimonas sp. CC8]